VIINDGSPEPPDDTQQVSPSTWPGMRAPHAWLEDGRTTLDLFRGRFTLVRVGANPPDVQALIAAAHAVNLPLDVADIDEPAVNRLYERRLVLVRPDGHVAWRGDTAPADARNIVDRVRGVAA